MLPLALLAKLFIAKILKDSIKAKVLAELHDAAEDPRNGLSKSFIEILDQNYEDFWDAVVEGLRR